MFTSQAEMLREGVNPFEVAPAEDTEEYWN
jgi:hypothetical protein